MIATTLSHGNRVEQFSSEPDVSAGERVASAFGRGTRRTRGFRLGKRGIANGGFRLGGKEHRERVASAFRRKGHRERVASPCGKEHRERVASAFRRKGHQGAD